MSERDLLHSDGKSPAATAAAGGFLRRMRRQVHARLGCLRHGRLVLRDALGEATFGLSGAAQAAVRVLDLSAYLDMATRGTLGAAEAYMRGKWIASDLTALMRVLLANRTALDRLDSGLAALAMPVLRLSHALRRNTLRQSRRNIGAHYDLGNEFYALFLDPTMSYSSAVYPRPDCSLEDAAVHKLDLICRKLALTTDDHLLETGTGWGGLALHAAGRYGCRVTTTTLSRRQREYTLDRVRSAGLADRITVLDRDYRELDGRYDKLVSVEMIEAVGLRYLDRYFRACSELLQPHGRMLLQGIVIADRFYERARRSVDFIQKHVFPGGALPSLGALQASVARATDLQLVSLHDIGDHYARTLRDWRERFMAQLPAVRQLGYAEDFIRMWEYYLAYCEGGFLERSISDVQLVLDKPGCMLVTPQAAG